MNKRMIWGLLGLAFIAGLGVADDLAPVAVSPGAENGPAVVRQSCPTFSWTAVPWALTYKVVVFDAVEGKAPTYEEIAAIASPVLVKDIPGQALSWTPSADEPLLNGGSYVWYVGAMINAAQGSWSDGRKFIVAEGPAWGVVSEPREDGTGGGGSRQVLRDKGLELTAAAKENFNLTDDLTIDDLIDIQGTEGATNTFYGTSAGNTTMTGTHNSFFGNLAGYKNTGGASNAFFGRAAGYSNTSGSKNTFIGRGAGQFNTTASGNTFVGYAAGYATTTGAYNAFVGYFAGTATTTGCQNTFVGYEAGDSNISGGYNSFFGRLAGQSNTTGNYNTFIGWLAGWSNQTGNENTFIGDDAGINNVSGSRNVFIGNEAGAQETSSEKLYIDNLGDTSPLIYGDFLNEYLDFNGSVRINLGARAMPTHLLDVGTSGAYCNGGAWVDGSSREFKENIQELTSTEALRAFAELEPVKFNYKEDTAETYLGFVAEDVPDLVAMNDRKGLNAMDMVAMLTRVLQEQQKAIMELREEITKLKKEARKEK